MAGRASKIASKITWDAKPHTVAKLEIVGQYLYAWASITGRGFPGMPLTYIDGFAGPGEYLGNVDGSPIAALASLSQARQDAGDGWRAGGLRALFVEQDADRYHHLETVIAQRGAVTGTDWIIRHESFAEGLNFARRKWPESFLDGAPLVVFIDPFGATGFPWDSIARILSSRSSEVILNFDSDGLARIVRAGSDARADEVLRSVFGGDDWKDALRPSQTPRAIGIALVALYKRKLRELPNVRYAFAFEMKSTEEHSDYFLLFASQHPTGLKKMKESMRRLDQDGSFTFCDASYRDPTLFRFDSPEDWIGKLMRDMGGRDVTWDEANDYILNETPFITMSKLMTTAQGLGLVVVTSRSANRRRNSFAQRDIVGLRFGAESDG